MHDATHNNSVPSFAAFAGQRARRPKGPGSDGRTLLQRYCSERDEEAFTALVYRHGGLVRSICRRVLPHDQDAEDAFQAAFLVFASKARSIRKTESVASWLHGVAYRVAMNAKRARRLSPQDSSATAARAQDEPVNAAALREVQTIVDEELTRLPERYRAPFVLCCLEGKSRAEAAVELGCKEGTVSSRMARARKELQQRLTRRGVILAAALCLIDLSRTAAPAIAPCSGGTHCPGRQLPSRLARTASWPGLHARGGPCQGSLVYSVIARQVESRRCVCARFRIHCRRRSNCLPGFHARTCSVSSKQ